MYVFNLKEAACSEHTSADNACTHPKCDASVEQTSRPPFSRYRLSQREEACQVYENFNFKHKYDDKLSIVKYRDEVSK